jgi:hypothetical protein
MVVDVGLLGVIPLLILAAVVVAMGERGMIVDVGMPRGPVFVVVAEPPGVVMADVPMVVAMLGRWVGVLGFLALALGPLPDVGHRGASFRVDECRNTPHAMCHVLADMVDLRSALGAVRGML